MKRFAVAIVIALAFACEAYPLTITYYKSRGNTGQLVTLQNQAVSGVGDVLDISGPVDWSFVIVRKSAAVNAGIIEFHVSDSATSSNWITPSGGSIDLSAVTTNPIYVTVHGDFRAARMNISTAVTGGVDPWVTITARGW